MTSRRRFLGRSVGLGAALALTGLFFPATAASGEGDAGSTVFSSDLDLEIGVGYDSNPFLAPSEAYFDQVTQAPVRPERRSGFYLPVTLAGGFTLGGGDSRFLTAYRLRADRYAGADTRNADEVYARLTPGLEWVRRGEGRRRSRFSVSPFAAYNKETYFDRDSGLDRVFAGDSVADRFTYTSFGADLRCGLTLSRSVKPSLRVWLEDRDYEELATVSQYDHRYLWVGADLELDLPGPSRLFLDYRFRVRDYDERPARAIDGSFLPGNDRLEYRYHDFGVTLRVRPARSWTLYLDADHRTRTDEFQGYNDYTRERYRLRSILSRDGKQLRIAVRYGERDHPNAFVFDLPVNPVDGTPNAKRLYETLELDLTGEFPLRERSFLFFDLDYRDEDSTDPRWTYERYQLTGGIRWRM